MDIMLGASVPIHISLLHVGIVASVKDPYFRFHSHVVHMYSRSLPIADPLRFVLTILELKKHCVNHFLMNTSQYNLLRL